MAKATPTKKKTGAKTRAKAPARRTSAADAERNKGMAIIAYIVFFIPLITGDSKKSPFVRYHTNQGTVLFLAYIAWVVVWIIIRTILSALIFRGAYYYALGTYGLFWGIASLLLSLVSILFLVLLILGIINAVNGMTKPLPVIGRFQIIK